MLFGWSFRIGTGVVTILLTSGHPGSVLFFDVLGREVDRVTRGLGETLRDVNKQELKKLRVTKVKNELEHKFYKGDGDRRRVYRGGVFSFGKN